jgi:hypothetical protein
MKKIIFSLLFISFPAFASIVGVSTHPLGEEGKALSAEMTGHMSDQQELGMGVRYTQEFYSGRRIDFNVIGAERSRSFQANMGADFLVFQEDINTPRVSVKAFAGYLREDSIKNNIVGFAPTLRKEISIFGQSLFPYLALPNGIKINSATDEFVFLSALSLGTSFNFPGYSQDNLLLSLEGNKNFGAMSDNLTCIISWLWD